MKLSCLQENLKRGLAVVGHAVAGKSTLPVLSNILLATDEGRLKLAAGDPASASRQFRAAIAAGALDQASAQCDLAESYLAMGDRAQARKAALAAIEVAPGYPRAQDLLLKVVGGK